MANLHILKTEHNISKTLFGLCFPLLIIVMLSQVFLENVTPSGSETAMGACERFFSRMGHVVPAKIVLMDEEFSTGRTFELVESVGGCVTRQLIEWHIHVTSP